MPELLYERVIQATVPFLGPVTERFIRRHIALYVRKAPEELSAEDIPLLAERVRAGLETVTDDRRTVEAVEQNIRALAAGNPGRAPLVSGL